MQMQSNNPALTRFSPDAWRDLPGMSLSGPAAKAGAMTVTGTVTATSILLLITTASAAGGWVLVKNNPGLMLPLSIGSLVLCLLTSFVLFRFAKFAAYISPVYAILQGLVVGGVSWLYAERTAGTSVGGATGAMIVVNAALATGATLSVMLSLYVFGLLKAGRTFRNVMLVGGIAIGVYFLASLGMSLFGVKPAFLSTGPIAIAITAAITLYSAFCLILDFDLVESNVQAGAPKYMEWYCGFALLVTLVWIYMNFLRLLSLLRGSNN
jgi:uncharacterized YccA/Bax inhibitor family protein